MSNMNSAKIFESKPRKINCGEIVEINVKLDKEPVHNYSIVEGTICNAVAGNYVIELVQLSRGIELPINKYCYVTSNGDEIVTYGFAFSLSKFTTELKVYIYMVAT